MTWQFYVGFFWASSSFRHSHIAAVRHVLPTFVSNGIFGWARKWRSGKYGKMKNSELSELFNVGCPTAPDSRCRCWHFKADMGLCSAVPWFRLKQLDTPRAPPCGSPKNAVPSQGASFSFRGWVLPSLWRMRVVSNAWFQRILVTSACRWPRCPNRRAGVNIFRGPVNRCHMSPFFATTCHQSWVTPEWLRNDSWRLRNCWLASPMLWSCALLSQQAVPLFFQTCHWMFPPKIYQNIKHHQGHQLFFNP